MRNFVLLRAQEQISCTLDVSLYNKEQSIDFRTSMLEREEQQRANKVKEIEEEIEYMTPYLARIGNSDHLSYEEALDVKYACLGDFKNVLLQRAINLQHFYEKVRLLIYIFIRY